MRKVLFLVALLAGCAAQSITSSPHRTYYLVDGTPALADLEATMKSRGIPVISYEWTDQSQIMVVVQGNSDKAKDALQSVNGVTKVSPPRVVGGVLPSEPRH